ncbi:MAG: carbon-phosphorus lyase complex subunit PhnI [Bacteroidales bacterium]|nr:carbon-phosphorus lyase complex subunit PhnI [Bacteroidales bacterium]
MAYVSVKGGADAIANAKELVEFYRLRQRTQPVEIKQIQSQFRLAVDKVMGEGSLYAPEYAALALKQMEGDVLESAFVLRAYRATLQRRYYSEILNTREMFVLRKISSSFREIPGGQVLGPTRDYTQRLIDASKFNESMDDIQEFLKEFDGKIDKEKLADVNSYNKVIDLLKAEGLLMPAESSYDRSVKDVTLEAIK